MRSIDGQIAELETRAAFPQHWKTEEQQLHREKLRQLIFEKAQLARESQLSGGVV